VETEELIMSRQRLNELVGTAAYAAKLNNDYGIDVSNKVLWAGAHCGGAEICR